LPVIKTQSGNDPLGLPTRILPQWTLISYELQRNVSL